MTQNIKRSVRYQIPGNLQFALILTKQDKMVFLQFPSKLTDEETMLQAKYAKLRKKKKQLAEAKNSANKDQKTDPGAEKVRVYSSRTFHVVSFI